jgi:hypothetical protein
MSKVIAIEARLRSKTSRQPNGCLQWTQHLEDGYGRIWFQETMTRVHRVVWMLAHGPIPADLMVDHLCHNRACCEISHLRLATRVQNMQNRAGAPKHSATGVRGVTRRPDGRYQVRVAANGRRHSGGYFASLGEAEASAIALRARLHEPVPTVPAIQLEG